MKQKIKKLITNPNRFFFDYFAKRLGTSGREGDDSNHVFGDKSKAWNREDFSFDEKVHPWVQLATHFNLRTGATTGHPDQSMLVNARELLDVLLCIFWIAHNLKSAIRIYTLGGGVNLSIPRETLWRMAVAEDVYKRIQNRPDFVVEFIGEFDNNFAAHFFPYDIDPDGLIIVRSERAYVKKLLPGAFDDAYPQVINEFGNWAFGSPWPVDVVYTWVNKDDPKWIEMWRNTFPEKSFNLDRFASKDELRYSLRALTKNMPWVHKIYIVSNCAKPSWLKENSRIVWVEHEEIFPDTSVLPVFNSHAIEACLHRIPDLNDHFIYFNDDMFVTQPCTYYDFFDDAGRSVAYLEPYGMILKGNDFDATRDFLTPSQNSQTLIQNAHPFYTATRLHKHTPYVLRKSVLEEIEGLFPAELNRTRANKIRTPNDINLPSFLFHHYALASGRAIAGDAKYAIIRPNNIDKLEGNGICTYKFLCFNDGDGSADNERYLSEYRKIMNRAFPTRSGFEISEASWCRIKISKTIMTHKTRAHRIPYIRRMVGDARISLDDGRWGLMENSKRCWKQHNKAFDFHLVIQDDAVISKSFYHRLHKLFLDVGDNYKEHSYSMFFRLKNNNRNEVLSKFDTAAKRSVREGASYMMDRYLRYGIAFMMPTSHISEMIEYAETLTHLGNHDDTRYSHFVAKKGIPVIYPLPSLVDQDSNCVSTHAPQHDANLLQATWFVDGLNGFPSEISTSSRTQSIED